MTAPRFFSVENVLSIHADTLQQDGGLSGVRDLNLLTSAVVMPQQQFGGQYLHPDLPAMAAAYLFHIVCNHPFLDGNKRAGAMAAVLFLEVNGVDLTASPKELEQTVLAVASGELEKDALIDWMRQHTQPQPER